MEKDKSETQTVNPSNAKTEEKQTSTKKVTLKQFIDENHKLFTVIGVMGGLAALFTRLENAEYLSVISFIMLLILDLQLWFDFPRSEEASISITIFEMFFQIFIFAIGAYLFTAYWTYIKPFLAIILTFGLFGAFAGIFIVANRKYKFHLAIRKITPERKKSSGIIRTFIASGIISLTFLIAYAISNLLLQLAGLT